MAMKPNGQTVVFHHVPKTAGTTMRALVRRQYSSGKTYTLQDDAKYALLSAFGEMSQSERDNYQLVLGHQAIRLANQLSAPMVITFLRNPISRVVSLYYYARDVRPEHPWHQMTNTLSIEQLFAEGIHEQWSELANGQCRSLMSWGLFAQMKDKLGWASALEQLVLGQNACLVVGLTERFDESLLLMRRRLGWKRYPYYERKNTNKRNKFSTAVSDKARQAIADHNREDLALYDAATAVFERALDLERKCGFESDLSRFRRLNEVFGRVETARGTLEKVCRRVAAMRGKNAE